MRGCDWWDGSLLELVGIIARAPPVEVAYYYGGISWIWEDGRHRVDLDTTCVSGPAGTLCRDGVAPAVRGPGIRT